MERLEPLRVLVTGGAGFIGAHLVELLVRKKYDVTVIDIQNPCKSYFFLKSLDKKTNYQIIDITKREKVEAVFASVSPTYVIHLAALPIVQEAYDNPYDVFKTNIMGTVHVLEACRRTAGIQGILVASSDKAYGKTTKPYTEESPLKGDHPYDVSKSCTDLIAQTYGKTYGLPVIVTRFGNVFGEGDIHFDRIIPGICKALITNSVLEVRSDGTYIRDYVYVKDIALATAFLIRHMKRTAGQAFNISSDNNFSVLDLIKNTEKILKKHIHYTILNSAKSEIPYQHLNDNKIRALGWKNTHSLRRGLQQTYVWYKKTQSYR
ncbi:MAG: CDP-glucose 4,6-dehydratase [Microgenomates group bacterium GW2011_GWC1_43_11]|uniref:CDP-glucose 4,6-dehydratase n=2 Tax=Candidatus Gottesmaniibacteriota TaxID=1752720 RepID=A0A0G1KZ78_9BACT|nr:MAG: CDP-glucose 4,6-dehydratase [Microgenomates group bacterium GW2011_GWC1_43_11]KKT39149.1 MAG: CDP-glucose 4,6-dehydratase [Candidatus Gottesmanbacteria bacterium GW2011_GWB1_44_11c]KKT61622.1 MAG: CDP-glucose 4,6-dehydratase [Candidatus Gottesmanbacteria bacterium GW2011_GWA1_44_24b]